VAENLEFRLGVAIGAVVAQAWSDGAGDPLAIPSLAAWRETTELPWFGFWAKELLRWGTLDPFVAFALAQGLARTRVEAAVRRREFDTWLQDQVGERTTEDLIDPQEFLGWQRSLLRRAAPGVRREPAEAELTGTDGRKGRYPVLPTQHDNFINWIDASGYSLARTAPRPAWVRDNAFRDDFELRIENRAATVQRIFGAR
jgi:hypothetical protein